MDVIAIQQMAQKIRENIGKVIIGKDSSVNMVIVALLSGGHILLEDVPGSGKTMLAKSLAKSIEGDFKRVQLTPDLLPADITGINYYNQKTSEFEFVKGPVFTNILIADEINRATPKTQSGLLESMEEKQVTVDGVTHILTEPFMVIATQNPVDTQGVFPLPEAQIDRFLIKVAMTYPEHDHTIHILQTHLKENKITELKSVVTTDEIIQARETIKNVSVHEDLIEYIVNIIEATREHDNVLLGVSTRGGLALAHAAQAYAAMQGRDYVMPDDIKEVATAVCAHRLILKNSVKIRKNASEEIMSEIMSEVTVPTEQI